MAIGYGGQASVQGLNNQLGAIAVAIRNDLTAAQRLFEFVNGAGVAGLEAIGFTTADATNFFNACNYLATVSGVYFGTSAQTPAFDFDDELSRTLGVLGGQ